jgi:hypothetical protein
MVTKAEKRKQKKRKARELHIKKMRNIARNNLGDYIFRLEVMLDGVWRQIKDFRKWSSVVDYQEETERERAAGKEIVEGRVISLLTGQVKLSIPPSKAKGALPDKLAENPASADKAVVDNGRELPDNLK